MMRTFANVVFLLEILLRLFPLTWIWFVRFFGGVFGDMTVFTRRRAVRRNGTKTIAKDPLFPFHQDFGVGIIRKNLSHQCIASAVEPQYTGGSRA